MWNIQFPKKVTLVCKPILIIKMTKLCWFIKSVSFILTCSWEQERRWWIWLHRSEYDHPCLNPKPQLAFVHSFYLFISSQWPSIKWFLVHEVKYNFLFIIDVAGECAKVVQVPTPFSPVLKVSFSEECIINLCPTITIFLRFFFFTWVLEKFSACHWLFWFGCVCQTIFHTADVILLWPFSFSTTDSIVSLKFNN